MYFMTAEGKEKKINHLHKQIEEMEARKKATDIRIRIFKRELEEAENGEIIEPIMEKAGLISRKDNSTT